MKPGPAAKNRKATQNELRRENSRLHDDLLTIALRVCHDLQTPLGGIMFAAQALDETNGEAGASHSPVASVLASADELSHLIRRISMVVKASARPIPPGPVAMGDAVFAALQRLESKILEKGAVISEPDAWPEVNGVSEWLEVIWWNLIANALQFAGRKPRIELGWRKVPRGVRFSIQDHGSGVAEDKIGHLFQPFHTLHKSNSARGLGLSIVQRLVALQGGHCGYKAVPGGGALFFFVLPER